MFPVPRLLVLLWYPRIYLRGNIHVRNDLYLGASMNIDTGGSYTASRSSGDDNRPVQAEHAVLFDPASTFLQSGLIIVRENHPVMLVGYMIPNDAEFVVEGVSVGSRSIQNGGSCCVPGGNSLMGQGAADIRFREPMNLGGRVWKINPSNRRIVITLPGTYLLVLNDDQYLGSVHVEMVQLGEVATRIPDAYMAGLNTMVAEA